MYKGVPSCESVTVEVGVVWESDVWVRGQNGQATAVKRPGVRNQYVDII